MRALIRSATELADLRGDIRRDLAGEQSDVLDDFVLAVNELVAATIGRQTHPSAATDVRCWRRSDPRHELVAEIRSAADAAVDVWDDSLVAAVVSRTADRVEFEPRIGGSMVVIRRRVFPSVAGVSDVADSEGPRLG